MRVLAKEAGNGARCTSNVYAERMWEVMSRERVVFLKPRELGKITSSAEWA